MTHWAILGVVLVVGLAGCSALPFGEPTAQKEPAPVMLMNNASLTETFEVAVVDVGANLTVFGDNGETSSQRIGQGSATVTTTSDYNITRIEFPELAHIHGKYTLEPGMRKQLSVGNVAPGEAIVVLVYDKPEGTYRSIKSLSCDDLAILGYRVTSQSGGSDDWTMSSHSCG